MRTDRLLQDISQLPTRIGGPRCHVAATRQQPYLSPHRRLATQKPRLRHLSSRQPVEVDNTRHQLRDLGEEDSLLHRRVVDQQQFRHGLGNLSAVGLKPKPPCFTDSP